MNTINNLTSSLISNQLPGFITNEYPLFVDFIQTYYQGLERSGESLDLVNNLLNYLDVDFYQNKISTNCIVQSDISATSTTITVDSTAGFPDTDGLIQIDSEIILYKSKTDTQFLSCSRGVSGVTNVNGIFKYSYSVSSSHSANSKLTNLSYLFILYFFSKVKNEYLPYFNQNFVSNLNISNFIKNIKQFYNVKGTSNSFDFLIRAFFNVKNETLYPRERIIKPSDAIYNQNTIILCKKISGNPLELVGQKLIQEDIVVDPCGSSIVGGYVYIDSVQEKFTENETLYELIVDISVQPNNIIVPPKTKLINPLLLNESIISVDSTIGFPKSGFLLIGNELIKYADKTLNQFLNCDRGYCNTTKSSYELSTSIKTPNKFYGNSNVDNSLVLLDILGISNNITLSNFSQNYFENDLITTKNLGFSDTTHLTNDWIFNVPRLFKISSIFLDGQSVVVNTQNNHNLHVGQSIIVYGLNDPAYTGLQTVSSIVNQTQFRYNLNFVSNVPPSGEGYVSTFYKITNNNVPEDVINVYDQNNEKLYVASSGIPSHSIGTGVTLGNQRFLKRIPRNPINSGSGVTITPGDVGIFLNGVLAQSCISNQSVTFGEVVSISIDNPGSDYGVGVSGGPSIIIANGTGTTATANCVVNGSLKQIYVIDGGNGYYNKPVVQIYGGGGSGALAEAIVNNGKISDIRIINSGSGYTSLPSISLIGNGSGAVLRPIVSGPISQVNITNSGSEYTSNPPLSINLGNGAIAAPIISNGVIQSVALISPGFGYNSSPQIMINDSTGKGTGAVIYANVANGFITSFDVISGGIGYSQNFTTISIVPTGKNAILTPKVRNWTFNLYKTSTIDQNNGYVSLGKNSKFGYQYSYLATPKGLRYQKSDNINSNLTELPSPISHSPIIGWAYDGNPIYGPYGYLVATDNTSGVSKVTSGYTLTNQSLSRVNGPSTSTYPLGTFVEDYVFTQNSNTLDQNNGRYCVTPEFPNGTYAYFTTLDTNGNPSFPYILGKQYYSTPDTWNLSVNSIQDNLPNDILRYRDPYLNLDIDYTRKTVNSEIYYFLQEDGISYILQEDNNSYIDLEPSLQLYDYFPRITNTPQLSVKTTETSTYASIDNFYIENSGDKYKVGDKLIFDNTNTGGYGASANVSYVKGVPVVSSQINTFTKLNYTYLNGIFLSPTNIIGLTTGSGATVYYVDNANNNIYIVGSGFTFGEIISNNYSSSLGNGNTSGTGTTISSSYISTTLASSIGLIDTKLVVSSGSGISIGSSLLIGNEIVKTFSGSGNTFGVYRGQFGTISSGYSSSTPVYVLPSISVTNSSNFSVGNYVKIDNEVFRIVDSNNSINQLSLLRGQLGSTLSSHVSGSTISQIIPSSAIVNKISQTSVISLSTGNSSYLRQYDSIKVSSGSTYDYYYTGSFLTLGTGNSIISYEVPNIGSGISGNLSYTTNSKFASGPVSEIQLNSGGKFYKILPKITISSDNGINASVIPQSENSGKIKSISIDNPGYDLNIDYTLKPELEFTKILKLNRTLVLDSINILDGGSGYQYIPNISITGGGGFGAKAIAKIKNQKITEISVINPGYGFSSVPTIVANKTYPIYINTFNSSLNFSINVAGIINSGDPISIYTDGNYPIIYGGLKITEDKVFYAVVNQSLNSNQIQLALTYNNAINNNYVQIVTPGNGNINLVLKTGTAILSPVLKTREFIAGETVNQYDNSGNVIASGIVSPNNGWQESTKTLRLNNVFGNFALNNFRIIGLKSNASGYVYNTTSASGRININSYYISNPNFVTETGILNNREQHIFDSDYYQNYSYVLKNEVDYDKWNKSIKTIAHPSGFKLYGTKTISSGSSHISTGQTSSFLTLQKSLYNNLSLLTYNNFAISQPDYTTSLKDQVTIYNRLLTSSEQIKTSKVDRIDDISDLIVTDPNTRQLLIGNGTTNTFNLPNSIKNIVTKSDISISTGITTDNLIITPPENYNLIYDLDNDYNIIGAKVVFNTPPTSGTVIKITCIGLNFDGINKNFPITFDGNSKNYNNNQILISLNGVIQTYNSYNISQNSLIRFSEPLSISSGASINILRVGSGASYSTQIIGTGVSYYTISSGASNNSSFVTIDGAIQNSDSYTINGNNIVFSENIPTNSLIYIRSYGSGISSKQLIGIGTTTNIVPISMNISSPNYAIVSINGMVLDPSTYSIGSGSTAIILSEQVSTGTSVYIVNFDQKVDYWFSGTANNSTDYIIDEKYSTSDDYIITINGVVQTPGTNNSYNLISQNSKTLNFTEAPKPRTKFFGLLYNRLDPSGNAVIDNFGQTYFNYNTINGGLVVNDYLQQESNGSLCNVINVDSINKIVAISGSGGTFGVGQTVISGLASSISTGTTTIVSVGSGITVGTNTFSVGSTIGFSVNDYILVDGEAMKINSISSGNTAFVVSRGLVATSVSYHPPNSIITKIIPTKFVINSVYSGFNGTGSTNGNKTFTLTTGGNPYNYNGTPFSLPSSQIDVYGQDYSQSLISILNGIIQDNNANGSFTISGSSLTFSEAPKENIDFYGRYLGKLRRLNDISSNFNGTKLSFNLNIGNNIIYSLIPPDPTINISNNVLIFINGVLQNPGESFTVVGSRIIFSEPPRPGTTFLGYVYIGSDNDVSATNILAPIESGDQIFIDGEEYNRDVLSVDSSSSLSTLGYNGAINGVNAQINATIAGGKISSLQIVNGGNGYQQPPNITFKGGNGYGAQAYATVKNGVLESVTITNPGANYTSIPQVIITRNLSLTKTQRVRAEYELSYKKLTTLGSGLSFGASTSLPVTNQSIVVGSANSFSSPGIIEIVDNSRPYPVIETITYTSINGNTLSGCVRGVGFNFNKVMKLDNTNYIFNGGQTITNGSGATANVINWDSSNALLFVNKTSTIDFSNGDTIVGIGAGISDSAFIQTYLSYGTGTTVIQVL